MSVKNRTLKQLASSLIRLARDGNQSTHYSAILRQSAVLLLAEDRRRFRENEALRNQDADREAAKQRLQDAYDARDRLRQNQDGG